MDADDIDFAKRRLTMRREELAMAEKEMQVLTRFREQVLSEVEQLEAAIAKAKADGN